jgi:hypothetical protein
MQNSSTKSTMMADNRNRRTTKLVLAFAYGQGQKLWTDGHDYALCRFHIPMF